MWLGHQCHTKLHSTVCPHHEGFLPAKSAPSLPSLYATNSRWVHGRPAGGVQQAVLLADLLAELGFGQAEAADAALHLLHLHLQQGDDVPLLVQLAQQLLRRGARREGVRVVGRPVHQRPVVRQEGQPDGGAHHGRGGGIAQLHLHRQVDGLDVLAAGDAAAAAPSRRRPEARPNLGGSALLLQREQDRGLSGRGRGYGGGGARGGGGGGVAGAPGPAVAFALVDAAQGEDGGHAHQDIPFGSQRSLAFQRPTTSTAMDFATPRTLFKKVLQTQPIVSPLVPEKPDSPKPVETVFKFPPAHVPCSNLEISLPESAPKDKSRIALLKTRSKKVRLSEFERGLNKQLDSSAAQALLDNTSLTKSLQISFTTPAPLRSAGKKGLIRRPKNYRGVNVKDFEGDIEQNLLQIKNSQSYLVDLQATTLLSDDSEMRSANTELFAHPLSRGQSGAGLSVGRSRHASARQSSASGSVLPSNQDAVSDMDVETVTKSVPKEILTPDAGSANEMEAESEEEADCPTEEQEGSLQDAGEGLIHSRCKEMLTPGTEHAGELEGVPQERTVTPRRVQQESLHGNSHMEQSLSPEEHLTTNLGPERASTPADAKLLEMDSIASTPADAKLLEMDSIASTPADAILLEMDSARASTPADAKLPEARLGHLSGSLHKKSTRCSVREMVVHIIENLDSSVFPAMDQGISEANLEEELFPGERAADIPQRTGTRTPSSRVSGKDPEQLECPATKETIDGTAQQAGNGGEKRGTLGEGTEHNEVSEAEMDPEAISEAETDPEKDEPTGKTPAFVRLRAFQCSPLLSTPHTLKVAASRSPSKQPSVKRVPRPAARARREKREPAFPSNFVKNIFKHYVRMPVAKDVFKAVEKCVNLYFKHLSDDLEVYTNHAKRKMTEPADLELLMRRQGLVTDKMPLNVLIERHLPLQYRKLLIPMATSGNKVIPPRS
ncbi:centromere protein T [Elgaria multicarinata webbii]|uniref:centromere protein T n=1 Tax=Elgaria multicarinata webbii TaxID=159646 RepID=UPI002FCCD269